MFEALRVALLASFLGALACASASADGEGGGSGPPYPGGTTDVIIEHGGPRRARVYVPADLGAATPRAVIVVLHGGGGEGLDVSDPGGHPLAVFREVADRERLVVVYPEGSEARDGRLGWTDCRADNLQASGEDDVGFLRAVVARMRADYGLAAERVFMAGTSNGGQMTMAFAAQAGDEIEAIAVGNANLPENPLPGECTNGPPRAIPALFVHGSADPAMPFEGGCVANVGGGCARGRVVGATATRDAYLALNGLSSTPTRTETVEVDLTDPGPAERFVHDGAFPVEWWRLSGAGHPPPSRLVSVPSSPLIGSQNRDVEFAEIAWDFFETRLPVIDCPTTPSPPTSCRQVSDPLKALFQLKADPLDPARAQVLFKWTKGEIVTMTDLGDPTVSTGYQVCVYDGSPKLLASMSLPAGGSCKGGKPCWKTISGGFQYRDDELTPDGLQQARVKEGLAEGKSSLQFKGKGELLPLVTLPLAVPVTVQVSNSEGTCWTASFGVDDPKTRNDSGTFKGKGH